MLADDLDGRMAEKLAYWLVVVLGREKVDQTVFESALLWEKNWVEY